MELQCTREAYGQTLVELGQQNNNIVVLCADLSGSCKTNGFAKKFPERFFNLGIAEANMINTAAGLAVSGKIPFVSTFAIFATGRVWEQIRNTVAYANLNVKIVATHGGISVGPDGASHQGIEDIALMRRHFAALIYVGILKSENIVVLRDDVIAFFQKFDTTVTEQNILSPAIMIDAVQG